MKQKVYDLSSVIQKMATIAKKMLDEHPIEPIFVVGRGCLFSQFEGNEVASLVESIETCSSAIRYTDPLGIAMASKNHCGIGVSYGRYCSKSSGLANKRKVHYSYQLIPFKRIRSALLSNKYIYVKKCDCFFLTKFAKK
ncbi:hypothetical protein [Enterococcus mundtii]|uniref:hypothetical protein n=1 Tax=Enterococcus mundtii TaxID=53346 RepID=UPI0035C72F4E